MALQRVYSELLKVIPEQDRKRLFDTETFSIGDTKPKATSTAYNTGACDTGCFMIRSRDLIHSACFVPSECNINLTINLPSQSYESVGF